MFYGYLITYLQFTSYQNWSSDWSAVRNCYITTFTRFVILFFMLYGYFISNTSTFLTLKTLRVAALPPVIVDSSEADQTSITQTPTFFSEYVSLLVM